MAERNNEQPLNPSDECLSTRGGCHLFAMAAVRLMRSAGQDWQIHGIFRADSDNDDNEESGLFSGYTNVAHFYVEAPDGRRFDADGEFNRDRYVFEKESETGWSLDHCPVDEGDIAGLVELGWLQRYNEADLLVASPLVREALAYEGVSTEPASERTFS